MKTREFTIGPPGTDLSIYHTIAHQNIDEALNELSSGYILTVTTTALGNNEVIYRGFGITGNFGAPAGTAVITLPNGGFDDANYDIVAIYLGEKNTAPASRTDLNIFAATYTYMAAVQTKTQFTIGFVRGGGNLACVGFSFIAKGTKTT